MSEIQWFTFTVAIIGAIMEIRLAIKNKSCSLLTVPWIMLFVHYIIFYLAWLLEPTIIGRIDFKYSVWSSILRGHEVITIVGYSYYRKNQRSCS